MSCGLWYNYEWDYCSDYCWDISEERKKLLADHEDIFNLSKDERKFILDKMNDQDNDSCNLYFELRLSLFEP